jgi:hypothetical protein
VNLDLDLVEHSFYDVFIPNPNLRLCQIASNVEIRLWVFLSSKRLQPFRVVGILYNSLGYQI